MLRFITGLIIVAVLLAGCAAPVNRHNANKFAMVGAAAQQSNDWDTARRAFARVVVNAELGFMAPDARAIAHYEYGRSLGATCFFDEAEEELNKANGLDKEAGQPLYLSLVELARLTLDQGKFDNARGYFERAFQELDKSNVETLAPFAYADILDEYVITLKSNGDAQLAEDTKRRATKIRSNYPKGQSITDRTPYGKYCAER